MINLIDEKAKQKFRAIMERKALLLQNYFMHKILKILKKQFKDVAKNIDAYNLNFNFAIDKHNNELINMYKKNYQRIFKEFGETAIDDIGKQKFFGNYFIKTFLDDFWKAAMNWINTNTAIKVVAVSAITKNLIAGIVKREMEAGKTNREIAKKIRGIGEISVPFRATRIARTETHTTSNFAINQAMKVSRMIQEKEWVSALDERTRTISKKNKFDHVRANGERVSIGDSFKRTGENLMYPGDMNGSPGNIINCRCTHVFYTKTKVLEG